MAKSQSQAAKDTRAKWLRRITDEMTAHKEWRKYADDAECAYFTDTNKEQKSRPTPTESYPLFPSTIKVIHGRIFSQPPKPDVRKRYADDAAGSQQAQPPGAGATGAGPQGSAAGGVQPPSPAGPPVMGQGGPSPVPPGAPVPGQQPAPGMQGAGGQPAQPVQTVDDNKIAQCIERSLLYTIDTTDFDADGHAAVNDFLVAALGVVKVEMDTDTEMQPVMNPMTGAPVMVDKETGQPPVMSSPEEMGESAAQEQIELIPAMQEVITDQRTRIRHFSWSQYHWEPQQNWSQVTWVAFDHWMTKSAIEKRFKVDLETDGGGRESGTGIVGGDPRKPQSAKYKDLFCVHEIWDKKNKERLFIAEEFAEGVLDREDDPLKLQDFFPCPKPMMLNIRGDDLVPMPDYTYCQTLFQQCNQLSNRIGSMIKLVKEVGFYDASVPELSQLRGNPPDGTYVPIAGMAQRIAQAGGKADGTVNSVLARWDNSTMVSVIQELLSITEVFKQRIWEIYGVPDILRGSTDPNETATAQQIKAQWADVRIGEKVRIVALHFRDVFRIMAEIMAEKFQPEILEKMTGIQLNDLEIQVLRSDYGRSYAIDVESDSTVVQDESAAQEQTMNFINTMIGVTEKLLPAVQQGMIPADLAKEMLLITAGAFKNGRQLEQAINALPTTSQQLGQMTQQISQLNQQLKGANDQAQGAMKQLQAVNMQKEQRANVETASKVQKTQTDMGKTQADTEHTQVLTAAEAQGIRESAMKPIPVPEPHTNVVPMKPGAA